MVNALEDFLYQLWGPYRRHIWRLWGKYGSSHPYGSLVITTAILLLIALIVIILIIHVIKKKKHSNNPSETDEKASDASGQLKQHSNETSSGSDETTENTLIEPDENRETARKIKGLLELKELEIITEEEYQDKVNELIRQD